MEYIIAAGPVIIENNTVLLVKHGTDNFWKFPGGQVDGFSELDLEKQAAREAKEELGIGMRVIRPLRTLLVKKENTIVVLVHFLAERIGDIAPGPDIREWSWLDIHHLPDDVGQNVQLIIKEYVAG